MNNLYQNWFKNPPKIWPYACALSGGMFASMLMKYGYLAFILCSILTAAINTYNFPKIIAGKGVLSGIIFIAQSSILIAIIVFGVISRASNITFSTALLGELCVVILFCQTVSLYLMRTWAKIKGHPNSN